LCFCIIAEKNKKRKRKLEKGILAVAAPFCRAKCKKFHAVDLIGWNGFAASSGNGVCKSAGNEHCGRAQNALTVIYTCPTVISADELKTKKPQPGAYMLKCGMK
jgi:hypothetical protein